MKKLRAFCDEMEDLLFGNEIFQSCTRGDHADPEGHRPVVRAVGCEPALSVGVDWDLRALERGEVKWNEADWKVWTHTDGDLLPAAGSAR
ncbi:MAG: hypothetical protein R2705_13625 [Ilumatobacteraceae bacterium]